MPLLVFITIPKSIIVPLFLWASSYTSSFDSSSFVLRFCGIFMALENGIRNLFFLSVFFSTHFAILSLPVNPGRLKRKWPVIPPIQ